MAKSMRLQTCQLASDFSDWPPLGIFDANSREVVGTACDAETRNLFIAAPAMLATLKKIAEGCEVDGRWLDPSGNECDETDEGASFEQYTGEEQDQWIASMADMAKAAIAQAERPAIPPSPDKDVDYVKLAHDAGYDGSPGGEEEWCIGNGIIAEGRTNG